MHGLHTNEFFTPVTQAYLICPKCGTMCCIDHEFRHGLLPVKRQAILRASGCGTVLASQETEKLMSIMKER
jgi:uncharacterized Zn finger protein